MIYSNVPSQHYQEKANYLDDSQKEFLRDTIKHEIKYRGLTKDGALRLLRESCVKGHCIDQYKEMKQIVEEVYAK